LAAQGTMMFSVPFEVRNPTARAQSYSLKVALGDEEQFASVVRTLPAAKNARTLAKPKQVGLVVSDTPRWCDHTLKGKQSLERVTVPAGGIVGALLVGEAGSKPSLVHVIQELHDKTVGGASFLLLPPAEDKS